jgi:putative membrane protein
MSYMHGPGWGWWLLMSLGFIAFCVALALPVIWLLRGTEPSHSREPQEPSTGASALEVLQRRLAAGEISVEEFEEICTRIDDGQRHEPVGAVGQSGDA